MARIAAAALGAANYDEASATDHRAALSKIVMSLFAKYGFEVRMGHVLDHKRDRKTRTVRFGSDAPSTRSSSDAKWNSEPHVSKAAGPRLAPLGR
jgi:hypothetical protein